MRKLLLLASLVLAGYFGVSMWNFSDAASWQNVNNYLPLGLMVLTFVLGLLHLRFALAVSLVAIFLLGTPALLNDITVNVLCLGESFAIFKNLGTPIESILLGLLAAWALVRFFGNPELDYEYNRANAVRALHFPVFILALCAVLGAVYAIISGVNVYYQSFWNDAWACLSDGPPFKFTGNGGVLAALRTVIRLLEALAVYVIVVNEVRSTRQVRFFAWLTLSCGVVISLIGLLQYKYNFFYGGVIGFNREIQSTIADPNALGVFLAALLPLCGALILSGGLSGVLGLLSCAILLVAIVLSETKIAILLAGLFLLVMLLIVLIRTVRKRAIVPLVLTGVLLVALIGAFIYVRQAAGGEGEENEFYGKIVKKVTTTSDAIFDTDLSAEKLNARSNYKFGDWVTAIRMLEPAGDGGLEHLICGVGYGRFTAQYNAFRPDWAARSRKGASNMLLQTGADTGVFGALALLLIVVLAIVYGFSAAGQSDKPIYARALTWALVVLALGCMTENAFALPQVRVLFWLLVGLNMVSASLAAREGSARGSVLLKGLILLVVLAAWGLVLVPKVQDDRDESLAINDIAASYAERLNLDLEKVRASLERTGDYGFNRKQDRWTEKNAIAMTKVTGPIISFNFFCAHPDVSVSNPVKAVASVDGEQIGSVTFDTRGVELIEYDLSENPRLTSYVDNENYILVRFGVDRTWVPAEVYPQFPDDDFDVGVAVGGISWREEFTPEPVEPAPEDIAPDAEPEAGEDDAGQPPAEPEQEESSVDEAAGEPEQSAADEPAGAPDEPAEDAEPAADDAEPAPTEQSADQPAASE